MSIQSLKPIFEAENIAIVGASKDPGKAAHQIQKRMIKQGFKGRLFPVNPREKEILGLPCYPSVADIKERLDLIVICVPARAVLSVMRQAADREDIKGAVIISAGFAETGIPQQAELQQEIVEVARAAKIRVFGPNCIGVINTHISLNTTFSPGCDALPGDIGYFTQSGALGGSLIMLALDQPYPLGYSKWAHVGNMCDVNNLEILEYYGQDPEVKVIAGYMEGVPNGRELMILADRITRKKPVLLLKVGRTDIGSKATFSHTGTLSGSDKIYDAAFAQSGIVRVNTVDELIYSAKALSMAPYPAGNRVCIITEAGGPGIIAMDELGSDKSVRLAPVTEKTQEAIKEALPPMAMVCKPNGYIDMTAAAMEKEHMDTLRLVLDDPNVDSAILISLPPTFLPAEKLAQEIAGVIKEYKKPVMVCFMKGEPMLAARAYLEEAGIPTFDTPAQASRALINMTKAAARLDFQGSGFSDVGKAAGKAHQLVEGAAKERRNLLEPEAIKLLSDYGLQMYPHFLVNSREEAVKAAKEIGFPVVLKIVSPQIIHKSEYKGVRLNLKNEEEVAGSYDSLVGHIKTAAPEAEIKGVLAAPFVTGGTEVIVGMIRDPQFGPVVMFGSGGIMVEVFQDVSFRVAPFSKEAALQMIKETKISQVLKGIRGEEPKDIDSLANLLAKIGDVAVDNPMISEMDLNPVLVLEKGVTVLDARVIIGE
ncbi:MAG: acetate--CoA ligase family protein [Syntrophaceticus schinkii]|jgi:acyl-CoA synthetase (NDP forming)|nr:acetate--CoA ligase family protein [Syntrophaceticus schinkii]